MVRRRFIPAWAGNANPLPVRTGKAPVHPRVGGERQSEKKSFHLGSGSSPRGRGTLVEQLRANCVGRFIPAWAGNAP